uniref:Uncharacterized protein n=1 Tax=Steinernema glaseri TaxID=37863 RepID=A0A1I8ABA7_9BILA
MITREQDNEPCWTRATPKDLILVKLKGFRPRGEAVQQWKGAPKKAFAMEISHFFRWLSFETCVLGKFSLEEALDDAGQHFKIDLQLADPNLSLDEVDALSSCVSGLDLQCPPPQAAEESVSQILRILMPRGHMEAIVIMLECESVRASPRVSTR